MKNIFRDALREYLLLAERKVAFPLHNLRVRAQARTHAHTHIQPYWICFGPPQAVIYDLNQFLEHRDASNESSFSSTYSSPTESATTQLFVFRNLLLQLNLH